MKYSKPEVEVLGSAVETIQSGSIPKFSSTNDLSGHPSVAAYEADE